MRRTLAALILSLTLATSTTAAATVAPGDDRAITSPQAPDPRPAAPESPGQALRHAQAVLSGGLDGGVDAPGRPEATLALRDLFVSLPRLTGDERARAEGLLARPTDGAEDPQGDGYTVRSRKRCSTKLCVHWVPSTRDRATRKWAGRTLRVMKDVWRKEVGAMGYRRPVKDGRRGGRGGKLDVYLSDVGGQGLYGYCAPEYRLRDHPRVASGYCVLDNDFARSEFGTKPIKSLKVTAAHEFFHAVQFAYDYREDPWLMEATATWMEERFADAVNDNRQYLGDSQVRLTHVPLDTFKGSRSFQYGNWVFFEFLSQRYGTGVVRRTWRQVGHFRGDGETYSVQGIKRVLPDQTSFARVYTQFVAANVLPGRSYPEGKAWPTPAWADSRRLGRDDVASGTVRISHLAANDFRLTPKEGLDRRRYRLRVAVDGPAAKSSPAATVVVLRRSGAVDRVPVRLGDRGRGTVTVPFNRRQTERVFVAVVNASTRYRCGAADFTYSCKGRPLDDGRAFDLRFKVLD